MSVTEGGGDSWEFSPGGGVPPGSPNPDLISDQKMPFSHLFSAPTSEKLWRHSLNKNASAHISFFLIHLELKRQKRSYTTVSKTIPVSRPKRAKSISVFRPTRRKIHTLLGRKILICHIRENPLGSVNWTIQLVFPSFFRDILTNHNTRGISTSVIGKYRSRGLGEGTPTIQNNFIIKVYFRDSRLSD